MKKRNTYLNLSKTLIVGIVFLGIVTSSSSCNKEKKEAKHRDVVTATINGQSWKAECEESPPFGCIIADLQYYPETGAFELATSNISRDTGLQVVLREIFDQGIYRINDNLQCGIIVKDDFCGRQGHFIDEKDPQEIEIIRIDNENKIIEGRFHFIGHDTKCGSEPVYVTNGYFKVRYRP